MIKGIKIDGGWPLVHFGTATAGKRANELAAGAKWCATKCRANWSISPIMEAMEYTFADSSDRDRFKTWIEANSSGYVKTGEELGGRQIGHRACLDLTAKLEGDEGINDLRGLLGVLAVFCIATAPGAWELSQEDDGSPVFVFHHKAHQEAFCEHVVEHFGAEYLR